MLTRIKTFYGSDIIETEKPVPLKPDKTVDYEKYVEYIIHGRGKQIDRNLCEVF